MKKNLITITVFFFILSFMLLGCGQSYAESPYAALLEREYAFGDFTVPDGETPSFEALVSTQDDMLIGPFQTYLLEYRELDADDTVAYIDEREFDETAPLEQSQGFSGEEGVVDGRALRNLREKRPDSFSEYMAWYRFSTSDKIPARIGTRRAAAVLHSKDVIVSEELNTGRKIGRMLKFFGRVFMSQTEDGTLSPHIEPEDVSIYEGNFARLSGSFLFVTSLPLEEMEVINGLNWALLANLYYKQFALNQEQNAVSIHISKEAQSGHRNGFGRYAGAMDKMRLEGTENLYDYDKLKALILEESAAPHRCESN